MCFNLLRELKHVPVVLCAVNGSHHSSKCSQKVPAVVVPAAIRETRAVWRVYVDLLYHVGSSLAWVLLGAIGHVIICVCMPRPEYYLDCTSTSTNEIHFPVSNNDDFVLLKYATDPTKLQPTAAHEGAKGVLTDGRRNCDR